MSIQSRSRIFSCVFPRLGCRYDRPSIRRFETHGQNDDKEEEDRNDDRARRSVCARALLGRPLLSPRLLLLQGNHGSNSQAQYQRFMHRWVIDIKSLGLIS